MVSWVKNHSPYTNMSQAGLEPGSSSESLLEFETDALNKPLNQHGWLITCVET